MVHYAAEENWVDGVDAVCFPPSTRNESRSRRGCADAWAAMNSSKEADAATC